MKQIIPVLLLGAVTAILFDTIWSLASRSFGFRYQSLLIVSFLIYAGVGFAAARHGGLVLAAFAGGVTSFIDATLGWYISWVIGPGRPAVEMTSVSIILTVIVVTLMGVMIGSLGGFISRLT